MSKITLCDDVPQYFRKQITATQDGNFIVVPDPFEVPNDVIQKNWLGDWLSGFDGWEVTTGLLEIKVAQGDAGGPLLTGDVRPDLSSGEGIDSDLLLNVGLHEEARSTAKFKIQYGDTLGADGVRVKSGLKLISIVNRVDLHLGKTVKSFVVDDYELVKNWFHEIACHAGRDSQGLASWHGDPTVESSAADIEEMLPKSITTPKLSADIKAYLMAPLPKSTP